jgi:DNA gyrase/topoisomerase IV subunit B
MANKQYTGKDIKALSDREHVRLRTQVYLGNTHPAEYLIPDLSSNKFKIKEVEFIPAVYKAVGEIIDNSLDEFAQIKSKIKLLKIDADPKAGQYTVADNGRGVPIDKHSTGKPTPEVVFGQLRSGRNFDDKVVGVIGQNGVGAACTNYCSTDFDVTIYREGKKYHQKFVDGALKASNPKISSVAGQKTGTEVTFQLDPAVFKDIALPEELMRNRAIEIAMTNPDITVEYNGERFRFKKGIEEVVENISAKGSYHVFTINEDHIQGEFYVVFGVRDSIDELMFTWVNSSFLFDGGKCNTQFFNAFFDSTIEQLQKEAKKQKSEVTRNDVRQDLLVLANVRLKNPEYDSQAKTRLTGPDLRKEISGMVQDQWKAFAKKNTEWLDAVLQRATERHHLQENKKAIEEHQKGLRKRVSGLLDATSRVRSDCQILITEGTSAKSQISEAREPETTAAYELGGKINNVYGNTPAQVLKMDKVTNLLSAIGLTPGKKATRSALNYGRIVIATDADYDGDDIFTLLVNLFFQFWPELFDKSYEPILYRLVAPNICLVKGKQRLHFSRRSDYEKVKDKYKGYEVRYYKGLGSMVPADWEMVLSGKTDTMIPIVDDGQIAPTLKLLFGEDADARKEWLTTV